MSALAAQQARFLATLYGASVPADPRVAIYHAALRANWARALAATYPVVQRLVGEEFFAAMARAYVQQFPSRSGDLNQLGAELASFLEAFTPAATLAYLPDVARLEWAIHEAGDAQDAIGFDFAALAEVPPERYPDIELRLAPWVRLLESPHPVIAIWEANQVNRDGSLGPAITTLDRVLVMRAGLEARPSRLGEAEWQVLGAIARGERLGAIIEALGDGADALDSVLARHAPTGVICGLRLPT